MSWDDASVLVTGAGGFIGSHLVELLVSQGARVRAFVRYNSRGDLGLLRLASAETLQQIETVFGDLRDSAAVAQAMDGMQYVFHLGAAISIPYSYQHPRDAVDINVIGTLNVLMAARQARPDVVVHTSTSEVYGTAQFVPMTESHPLQGQSPYSASKIGADKLVESFHRSFGVPAVTVRPFNAYGPRQSTRAVIPTIITQALSGDVVRLGALDPTRDFTFVTDLANGFLKAAESPAAIGREVNVSSSFDISIGDLAHKIIAMVGRDVKLVSEDQRFRPEQSEVRRLYGDSSLARHLIGWEPTISLDEGLARTIAWFKQHLDLYRPGEYRI